MKSIHVFTSAACNYIPKVRVLVESIKKWHPDWVIHLALSDEIPESIDLSNEPFDEIHPARSLNIPDFDGWAFCHTIVELSTAIKPFMLKKLLDRDDCKGVIYLDPDTVIFSPLTEVLSALENSNYALTPHQIMPESNLVSVMDNEISSLKHGIYNLGFLAVSPSDVGKAFADWWANRLYYFCRAEIPNGLFTDQRWIDLAPAFFEGACILRSSRLNVAPWNLTTRKLSGNAPFYVFVDDQPLGFYHFTGFDSGAHKIMANKNASGNPTVQDLINWYLKTTESLSKDPLSQIPWFFGRFNDGSLIPKSARLIYRERLDLQYKFPNPFETISPSYKTWWENQGAIEYPKLHQSNIRVLAEELLLLQRNLTPGFQAGKSTGINSNALMAHIKNALTDASYLKVLGKKTWEVLRTEGFSGVTKRLSN